MRLRPLRSTLLSTAQFMSLRGRSGSSQRVIVWLLAGILTSIVVLIVVVLRRPGDEPSADTPISSSRPSLTPERTDDPDRIVELTAVIRQKPNSANAYNQRALVFQEKREFDKAISDLTEAIRLKPDSAVYQFNRAVVYAEKDRIDEGVTDLTEAIRLKPDFQSAFLQRGALYARKGNHDDAIADLTEAIRLKPNDGEAYAARGIQHFANDAVDKANSDFNNANRLKQDGDEFPWTIASLRWVKLTVESKHAEAIRIMDSFLTENPNSKERHEAYHSRAISRAMIGYIRDGNVDTDLWFTDMCYAIRSAPSPAIATEFYWGALSRLRSDNYMLMHILQLVIDDERNAKESGVPRTSRNYYTEASENTSKHIASLPVKNVDQSVVEHAAVWIKWADHRSVLHKRKWALKNEKQASGNQAFFSGLQTALRLATKDPNAFSSFEDLMAREKDIGRFQRELQVENVELDRLTNQLAIDNLRLRRTLAAKYGKEFAEFKKNSSN